MTTTVQFSDEQFAIMGKTMELLDELTDACSAMLVEWDDKNSIFKDAVWSQPMIDIENLMTELSMLELQLDATKEPDPVAT